MANNVEKLRERLETALPDPETLQTIAQSVGCSVTHLTNVRAGRYNPSMTLAARLSEKLGIPLKLFVTGRRQP